MFSDLFSKRIKPKPDKFRYDIPQRVRSRIVHHFDVVQQQRDSDCEPIFDDTYKMCLLAYGQLEYNENRIRTNQRAQQAAEHFFECSDEMAVDFIELCFKSREYRGDQQGVEMINAVLREEGIGYEFSPYVTSKLEMGDGRYSYEITHPKATKKTDEVLHSQAAMPALMVLTHPLFKTANSELLNAHEHFRHGKYEATITAACQTFESVFKVICTKKKWKYDPHKDTLAKLVEICRDNGLFPAFYTEIFKNVGTIRNRMGGHGGGNPGDSVKPDQEHAENMIYLVSSHLLLLVKMVKL